MFFVSLYRLTKFALQNFFRNFWLSIVTITIIVLSLVSVNTLVGLNVMSDAVLSAVTEKVDIALYFKADVTDEEFLLVREEIRSMSDVKKTEVITSESAFEFFKTKHAGDTVVLEALNELEENPLGPVLLVQADDIYSYSAVLDSIYALDLSDVVDEVDFQDRRLLINRLNSITQRTTLAVTVVSAFFMVIAILVVFNTIRLGIYAHKEEIAIMKLVGASNWFTRAPFLIEGFLYAFISCVIFWLAFLLVLAWFDPLVSGFLSEINFSPKAYFSQNFWVIFSQQLIGLTLINMISAFIAIRRYLRV